MRKSRFSEDQIIAILKESEAGVERGELCRRHVIARRLLPVEEQVRRAGVERGNAAAASGGGVLSAQAHRGRTDGGYPGVEVGGRKKVVSPQARREAVLVMQAGLALAEVGRLSEEKVHDLFHETKMRRRRCRRCYENGGIAYENCSARPPKS